VPKNALDFIQNKQLGYPVLHTFDAGGYVMYRSSSSEGEPRHLVALDGRTNVNRPDIWDMYERAYLGREGWEALVDSVKPKTIMWPQNGALVAILLASPDWCRVYQSGKGSFDQAVFVAREEFEKRRGEFQSSDCS
jgi:hypothetical protein